MKHKPEIITERLTLRLAEISEAELMYDFVMRNKAYLKPWEPLQLDEYYTQDYWSIRIAYLLHDYMAGNSCCFNLYLRDTNQLIGMINYSNIIYGAFHSCFLGFKIDEYQQGKGLMFEALTASIPYIFTQLNLHRISANYMPHNIASGKLLTKLGFQQEGVAKDYLQINGKWETHILTSLLNDSWLVSKKS